MLLLEILLDSVVVSGSLSDGVGRPQLRGGELGGYEL